MSRPAKSKVVTLSPSGDVLSSVVVRDPQAPGGGWQVKLGDDIVASGAGAMPRDWFERVADRFPRETVHVHVSAAGDFLGLERSRRASEPLGGWRVFVDGVAVAAGPGDLPAEWPELAAVEPAAPQLEPWERVASRVDVLELELGTLRARIDDMQHTIDAELLKAMERTINALPAGR